MFDILLDGSGGSDSSMEENREEKEKESHKGNEDTFGGIQDPNSTRGALAIFHEQLRNIRDAMQVCLCRLQLSRQPMLTHSPERLEGFAAIGT